MKKVALITSVLIIGTVVFSSMGLRKHRKHEEKVNYGLLSEKPFDYFLRLNDSILFYNYEITNLQYGLFLDHIAKADPKLYDRVKPDSSLWLKGGDVFGIESVSQYYHTHPAYDAYPVVNIPKEGAEAFCAWLTEYHGKGKFRLPTEREWMEASGVMPGHNLPWRNNMPFNEDGGYYSNLKYWSIPDGVDVFSWDGAIVTSVPGKYDPSPGGVYDMIGNVAEMVSDKDVVKGGSWDSYLHESTVEKSTPYAGPDCRVGFRVVMEF